MSLRSASRFPQAHTTAADVPARCAGRGCTAARWYTRNIRGYPQPGSHVPPAPRFPLHHVFPVAAVLQVEAGSQRPGCQMAQRCESCRQQRTRCCTCDTEVWLLCMQHGVLRFNKTALKAQHHRHKATAHAAEAHLFLCFTPNYSD